MNAPPTHSFIGKGEFGDVYLAATRHLVEDRAHSLVMVKGLNSHEPHHVNEFHRQLEIFSKLQHSNVVQLLGVCMEQEPFYMLLEYCEWVSFSTRENESKYSVSRNWEINYFIFFHCLKESD